MSVDVGFIGNSRDEQQTCEVCGEPITGWHRDIVDDTDVLRDRFQVMIPGQAYNEPCGCRIPGTEARPRPRRGTVYEPQNIAVTNRTPSGEHTSADTDDVVAGIDAAMEDWELEAARWSPDGSHEHDPPFWTRMDHGNSALSGQADGGCDDVAERMRPGSTACFPWDGAQANSDQVREAAREFTDAIHQMQMSLYRSATRVTRQWSEIFADLAERNEPVRVHLYTGRCSGRTEAIRRLQRGLARNRIAVEPMPPHGDLEPLELPTIRPGDEVTIHWPGGSILPQTIDEHERRTRASWEGLT